MSFLKVRASYIVCTVCLCTLCMGCAANGENAGITTIENNTVNISDIDKESVNQAAEEVSPKDEFTGDDFYYKEETYFIQAKVLEWKGYPAISTKDELFTLLDEFKASNKTTINGDDIITFLEASDDEYIERLGLGCVLAIYDKWDNFSAPVCAELIKNGMDGEGCDYMPIILSGDEDTLNNEETPDGISELSAKDPESKKAVTEKIKSELSETALACLEAYGADTYAEFAHNISKDK